MFKLKPEILAAVKADSKLVSDLATLNAVSPFTVQDHLQRNREELTKMKYLWPIAKKLGFDNLPMYEVQGKLCEFVEVAETVGK